MLSTHLSTVATIGDTVTAAVIAVAASIAILVATFCHLVSGKAVSVAIELAIDVRALMILASEREVQCVYRVYINISTSEVMQLIMQTFRKYTQSCASEHIDGRLKVIPFVSSGVPVSLSDDIGCGSERQVYAGILAQHRLSSAQNPTAAKLFGLSFIYTLSLIGRHHLPSTLWSLPGA